MIFGRAQPAKQEPPNPFARQGYNDWDTMGGPREFAGDGFDSDTTDFVSQASRLPLDQERAKLFATDDHVVCTASPSHDAVALPTTLTVEPQQQSPSWSAHCFMACLHETVYQPARLTHAARVAPMQWLPGNMEWDGQQLRRRIGAAFANGYDFAMGAGGPPQPLRSDNLYPADSAMVMPFGGAVRLQSFEPNPRPQSPPRMPSSPPAGDTGNARSSLEQMAMPPAPPPQRARRRATPEALDRLHALSDQRMSSDNENSDFSSRIPRRSSSSAPGAAMTAQHPPLPPQPQTQSSRRASGGTVHDSATSSPSSDNRSPLPAWTSPHHLRLGLSSFLLSAICAWLLYCFSHPESRFI